MQPGQQSPQLPPLFPPKVAIPAEHAKQMRFVTHAQAMVAKAMVADENGSLNITWPPVLQAELAKLTFKQRQYAVRIAGGQPQIEAYRASYEVDEERGDNELTADVFQLRHHPKIATCVELIRSYLSQQWLSEALEVKEYVASLMYEQSIWGDSSSAKIKAGETLLRMHGLLIDRKEITHRDANEMDEQASIFASILNDCGLGKAVETEYVVMPQQLTGPSTGYVCPACNLMANPVVMEECWEFGAGV